MSRRKSILILPVLKDRAGDVSKRWFVEFSARNPQTDEMKRFRYNISGKTKEDRYAKGNELKDDLTKKLMSGWSPYDLPKVIFEDEIEYANAAKTYGKLKEETVTVRRYLNEFLALKKSEVNAKSFQTYQSRLRNFYMYLEKHNFHDKVITRINNRVVLDFLVFQQQRDDLSVLTMSKYKQILFSFFNYLYKAHIINENPAVNLPRLGKVVDKAPSAMTNKARKELSALIEVEDPQLHLACLCMFYAAIRPGEELRKLKIKHINMESKTITVMATTSKKNRHETIVMPNQLVKALELYNLHLFDEEFYLLSRNGRPGPMPLGVNTLANRFKKIRDKYNFSKEYKFYSWKHTGAQALKDADVSPYVIQQHLRHQSFETTERYLRKRLGQNNKKIISEFPDL